MIELKDLPDEILEFILSYLPPYKELDKCKTVCKRWKSAVENVLYRGKINFIKGFADYNLCWTTHKSGLNYPSGRFSHAFCTNGDSMYIFGGGSSSDTTFNDLWRFDLSKREWIRPITMGNYPSPKGSATMISYRNKLILFGGWRYPSFHPPHQPWCLFDELHCYDIKENRWTIQNSLITPPVMAGHSATLHGDTMVIFGGYQCDNGHNTSSNDVWTLDLKTFQWSKPVICGNGSNSRPPPRYGQLQIALDDKHLMIMGGSGGFNNLFSDCWILDMAKDVWQWHCIPIKNKKWAATHMWNSPACRIGNKIVVCGPTPSVPPDFQILKHRNSSSFNRISANSVRNLGRNNDWLLRNRFRDLDNPNEDGIRGGVEVPGNLANIAHQPLLNNNIPVRNNIQNVESSFSRMNKNNSNTNGNNNNNVQINHVQFDQSTSNLNVARNTIKTEDNSASNPVPKNILELNVQKNLTQQQQQGALNEAVNRLQRNLALRARDNDIKLPLRFNEQQDGQIYMAAFNVQQSNSFRIQKEHRQQERIRRLNEKLNQFRNAKKKQEAALAEKLNNESVESNDEKNISTRPVNNIPLQQKFHLEEPKPKRVKRNVLGMFVCDISNIFNSKEPFLEWIEYKNYGILPGAPERLIFASLVPGKNELILFGGVQKESLCSKQHKVSHLVHFLSAPKEIV